METRRGTRYGIRGALGDDDDAGAPDSPVDEFVDAEHGLAGSSPPAAPLGAFAAAAALRSSPAPAGSLRAGSAPPAAPAHVGVGATGAAFASGGVRGAFSQSGNGPFPGRHDGPTARSGGPPAMGAFGAPPAAQGYFGAGSPSGAFGAPPAAQGYFGAGSPSPFGDAGRGPMPPQATPFGAASRGSMPTQGAPPRAQGRGAPPLPPGAHPGRGGGPAGGQIHGGLGFDRDVGQAGVEVHPGALRLDQFERGLQELVRHQDCMAQQAREEPPGSPFWRTSGSPSPPMVCDVAPGPADALGKVVQTLDMVTETLAAANLFVPRSQAEMQAEAALNGVFKGPALRMWQETKAGAGVSTTFVGHGSRLYRRLSALLRAYAPHDPREEWKKLRNHFRWQNSLGDTERVFNELVAAWTELARQSEGRIMADQVPYPDEQWLWEVLSQAPGVPAWVLEKSKTQAADFHHMGVFAALRKHSAGLKHTGSSSTMGMPRVHALSREAHWPDALSTGSFSVSDLAAAAAAMGFGLAPLPSDGEPMGAASSLPLGGARLCAVVDAAGVLRAKNDLPIECHICQENHFKSDCPKLDTSPCFYCGGGHTLRTCPTAPPALSRPRPRGSTPTRYVRPGLGLPGQTFVSGPAVHMMAGAAPLPDRWVLAPGTTGCDRWALAPGATRSGVQHTSAAAFPGGVPTPPGVFEPEAGSAEVDWDYVRDLERYVQRREDRDREDEAAAAAARPEDSPAAPTPAVGVQWTHGARFSETDAAKPGNV